MGFTMNIQIKLLDPKAKIPTRGSYFSAGYDLYTIEEYELKPGERHLFKTGVSTAMPDGVYGRIAPRSGLAYKQGIDVMAGVIDSDYRGEIGVLLVNLGQEPVKFPIVKDGKETAIAQIIFESHNEVYFDKTEVLPESQRNTDGFSSSDRVKVPAPNPPQKSTFDVGLLKQWKEKHWSDRTSHSGYEAAIKEREKQVGNA
jgi:dUTP pyrophosphatase